MPPRTSETAPPQILMLGRGIEPNNAEHPGTLQPHPSASGDAYDRAVFTADYTRRNAPEVVAFSGRHTFVMPPLQRPDRSEAKAGLEVALQHGFRPFGADWRADVVIEGWSYTTYENFLNSLVCFNLDKPIGVIAQDDHMDRALAVGSLVAPQAMLVPLVVPNSEHRPVGANHFADKIASKLYGLAMRGVEAGDRKTIRARDQLVQRSVLAALAVPHLIAASRFANSRVATDRS